MSHVHSVMALSMSRRDLDNISTPRFDEDARTPTPRSPTEFEPDEEDGARHGVARAPTGGLLLVKYRKRGMPRLYDGDDTTDALGPLPRLMQERLAKVERELAAYEDRRSGIGKAFSFMSRLEQEIAAVTVADADRARTAYEQEAALNEQRQLRKAAEAKAVEAEADVFSLKGKVQSLQKRIFVLERQKDLERAAFVDGFRLLAEYVREREVAVTALAERATQRVEALRTVVADRVAHHSDILEARRLEAERQIIMLPEEYAQHEPLSQKGIKSYVILHKELSKVQAALAASEQALKDARTDHATQLSSVQRRLHAAQQRVQELSAEVTTLRAR